MPRRCMLDFVYVAELEKILTSPLIKVCPKPPIYVRHFTYIY